MFVVFYDFVSSLCSKEIAATENHANRELNIWISKAALSSQRRRRTVHDVFERQLLDQIGGAIAVVHQADLVYVCLDLFRTHLWLTILVPILWKLLLQSERAH